MAKSRDAFRTISEVADWLDTPAHVLRFWESKFTQIKPVKRAGGRRYYRPQDMALLGGIKTLLHEQGMTIKGAQKLLREKGVKHVSSLGTQPGDDTETGQILELKAVTLPDATPAIEQTAPDPAPEPKSDDPWPADPWSPEATPDQVAAARAAEAKAEEEARAEAAELAAAEAARIAEAQAEAAAAQAIAEAEAAAQAKRASSPAPRRGIPPLPDPAGAQARPGILATALAASPRRIAKNRERILPLVDRLHTMHRRMGMG